MIIGLFVIVSLKTSLVGDLSSFAQLNYQPFFSVRPLSSVFVSNEISVGKISPDFTFSIEFASLSTSKSSPLSFLFFTL